MSLLKSSLLSFLNSYRWKPFCSCGPNSDLISAMKVDNTDNSLAYLAFLHISIIYGIPIKHFFSFSDIY